MNLTRHDLKQFIIQTLSLEDLRPEDIEDEAPLFREGLGLDSIDALELGIALRKTYQVQISGEDPEARAHFRSVATLHAFVTRSLQA